MAEVIEALLLDYSLDLDHLTKVIPSRFNQDGTYSVDVALWNATSDKASMAATALDSKAKIIVKDGKATMYISTKENVIWNNLKASLQRILYWKCSRRL